MWPICRRCIFILYYLIICYFYIIVDNNIYVQDDRHCPWIVCYDSDLCSIYLQMYRQVRWIMNDDELGCATEFTWSFTKSLIAISSWFVSKIIDSDCFLREKCTRTQSPISWCLIHSCKVWWSFSRVSVTDTNNIFILINWSACSHVLFFWGGGAPSTIAQSFFNYDITQLSASAQHLQSNGLTATCCYQSKSYWWALLCESNWITHLSPMLLDLQVPHQTRTAELICGPTSAAWSAGGTGLSTTVL